MILDKVIGEFVFSRTFLQANLYFLTDCPALSYGQSRTFLQAIPHFLTGQSQSEKALEKFKSHKYFAEYHFIHYLCFS